MEYSILKEVNPKETVDKIVSILKKVGIEVEEKTIEAKKKNIYNPYSLRVEVKNSGEYGTNGKGRSFDNARASAYAEFIERCQNNLLIPFELKDFYYSSDEKIKDVEVLLKNPISNILKDKDLLFLSNALANRLNIDLADDSKTLLTPFYSLKDNKSINLPILIFRLLQTSNGMAAGNTIEEALVQGLSEICERFSIKKVIEENISLPDVPKDEWEKYANIKGLIDIFKENNYEVSIKDASLGHNFPVICTVIKDLVRNTISLSFGAHPSLPVAIERCLTEFCQGIDITNRDETIMPSMFVSKETLEHNIKNNNLKFLAEKTTIHKVYIQQCEYLEKQFYTGKSNFTFSRNSWIKDEKNITNKNLLKFLLNTIKNYTDEIYIRDVSFLGFPSVYIVIPKMSFIMDYDKERIKNKFKLYNWLQSEMTESILSIDSLFEALYFRKNSIFFQDILVSDFPNEYLLFLCSVLKNDYKNIQHFGNIIIEGNKVSNFFKQDLITRVEIIKKYFKLEKQNKKSEKQIYEILAKEYTKEDIEKVKAFFKYLSFEVIKRTIISYKRNKKRKSQVEENKELFETMAKNLEKYCVKNIIDQNHLAKVFERID